jgi:hypothetical protein
VTPFLDAAIDEMLHDADPAAGCRECGFAWTAGADELLPHIDHAGDRFSALLDGRDAGRKVHPDRWCPSAYVWHVSDVMRAWAERLHSRANDPAAPWAGFDPDELGRARRYDELPPVSAPWAVRRSTDALVLAIRPLDPDDGFEHPEWGHGTVTDALRWVTHEILHHDLDIRRDLGLP